MTYTNKEYADMAIEANKQGKALRVVKGKLTLVEPEPITISNEQIKMQNQSIVSSLITEASIKIATIKDSIDLNMADDNDTEQLKAWQKYRILLDKLDLTMVDIVLPEKPV